MGISEGALRPGGGGGINVTDSPKGLRACAFAQNRG